jgi:hypothetical protein
MWIFEHWDNGKVYLHNQRWGQFFKNIEENGDYPHNWDHTRFFCQIHSPRNDIGDLPNIKNKKVAYKFTYNVIYQPYPAFVRTELDPEGWLPSWHIWSEDNHPVGYSEEISFLNLSSSNNIYFIHDSHTVVNFHDKFWLVESYVNYGVGPHRPPVPPKKNKSFIRPRSIYEPFENPW